MIRENEHAALGPYLKWARGGYSLRALAKKSGIDHSAISKFERGLRVPTPAHLLRLANALELDHNFVLMKAGYLELPGIAPGVKARDEDEILSLMLAGASVEEKRSLVAHLTALRMVEPIINGLFDPVRSPSEEAN
jgi:transcriptional regulator with XRE-family HTH domain